MDKFLCKIEQPFVYFLELTYLFVFHIYVLCLIVKDVGVSYYFIVSFI